jgi:biopolymer transport protein ExbD
LEKLEVVPVLVVLVLVLVLVTASVTMAQRSLPPETPRRQHRHTLR